MNESSESLTRNVFLCFSGTLNFFSNFLNLWMGDNVLHNLGTLGLLFLVLFPMRQQIWSRDSKTRLWKWHLNHWSGDSFPLFPRIILAIDIRKLPCQSGGR